MTKKYNNQQYAEIPEYAAGTQLLRLKIYSYSEPVILKAIVVSFFKFSHTYIYSKF